MDILAATPKTGLSGYYLTPIVGAYFVTASGNFIADELISKDTNVLDVDQRPESDQYLQAWEQGDLERLCLENQLEQKGEIEHTEGIKQSSLFEINREEKIEEQI